MDIGISLQLSSGLWIERKKWATENVEAKAQALRDLEAADQGDGDVNMEDAD